MSFLFSGIFGKKSEDNHQSPQQDGQRQQQPPQQNIETPQPQQNQNEELKIQTSEIATNQAVTIPEYSKRPREPQEPKIDQAQQNKDKGGTIYNPPPLFMGLQTKTQPTSQESQLNTSQSQTPQSNNNSGLGLFGGLNLNSDANKQPPQQQQQQQTNPLFAGLNLNAPKAQPQMQSNPPDLFSSLNMASKQNNQGSYSNPYQKQGASDFAPPSFMQGPAFQTPSQLLETSLQKEKEYAKDDPFSGLTFTYPSSNNTQPTNLKDTSGSSSSMFQFLTQSQPQQKTNEKSEQQKEIGDISMSSINNMSKNSFEEVEKQDIQQHSYQKQTPNVSQSQSNTQQTAGGSGLGGFYFMQSSTVQSSANQQTNNMANSSIGNFEMEKDINDDNFEQITESKDIIEDRINRIKSVMIEHTIKQQDLSEKIQNLQKDIELLQLKLEDTTQQQQRAIENEDYDEADQLNMRITQTKNLILSKESQIKRLDEDYMGLENKKSDKYKELSQLIHKSIDKMSDLKEKQIDEMAQFEESELSAIEQKRKRLHYESIRIDEINKEIKEKKDTINSKLMAIEEQVYEDTRPQQLDKQQVEVKISIVNSEILEIEQLLKQKRAQLEQLTEEKTIHEKEIDKSRAKFRDQIHKLEKQLEVNGKEEDKNLKDFEEQKRENNDLLEYQETYKTRLEGYQKELKELEEFEKQLKKNSELIDSTLNEKESCKDSTFMIKQEINQLKIKRDNANANKEYINEKLAKVDAEVEELQHQINNYEKKISKLEQAKKKAAAEKKFKEASKAQSEIKDFTTSMEEAANKLQQCHIEKDSIDKDIVKKEEELREFEYLLKENQVKFEKEQLKLLTYRKEDILDLLQSLKNMSNVKNLKKKSESLENELLKIDNELFELEKKYGEFKIRSSKSTPQVDKSDSSEEQIRENMPEVENSSMPITEEIDNQVVEDVQEQEIFVQEEPQMKPIIKRSREEIQQEIQSLEEQVKVYEIQIDEAVEAEDYEKADYIQSKMDSIQDKQLKQLREELENAEEGGEKIDEEEYNPPDLGLNFGESPVKEEKIEEKEQINEEEGINQEQEVESSNIEQQHQQTDEDTTNQQVPQEEEKEQKDQEEEKQEEVETEKAQENNESPIQEDSPKEQQEEKQEEEANSQPPIGLFAGMQLK